MICSNEFLNRLYASCKMFPRQTRSKHTHIVVCQRRMRCSMLDGFPTWRNYIISLKLVLFSHYFRWSQYLLWACVALRERSHEVMKPTSFTAPHSRRTILASGWSERHKQAPWDALLTEDHRCQRSWHHITMALIVLIHLDYRILDKNSRKFCDWKSGWQTQFCVNALLEWKSKSLTFVKLYPTKLKHQVKKTIRRACYSEDKIGESAFFSGII